MAKIGKISAIKKEYKSSSQLQTMETNLSQKGFSRIPGTGVFKFPYKEMDGTYRTGLDEKASYIRRIQDPTEREIEIKKVKELREKLTGILGGIDLSSKSPFWNFALSSSTSDVQHVQPVKLMDGDNLFDFSDPLKELAFAWLRVHPTIASSLQAYERGDFPADTQFYIVDDEVENAVLYNKKKLINKAIVMFDSMTPSKKIKVARLLGLPVSDDSKEEEVYNLVDDLLKQTEFKEGKYRGLKPLEVFSRYANMQEQLVTVKDLVKQAIAHSIYRVRNSGKVYEGDFEVAKDEDDLVKYLIDEDHQDDLLTLEGKLKSKKLVAQ